MRPHSTNSPWRPILNTSTGEPTQTLDTSVLSTARRRHRLGQVALLTARISMGLECSPASYVTHPLPIMAQDFFSPSEPQKSPTPAAISDLTWYQWSTPIVNEYLNVEPEVSELTQPSFSNFIPDWGSGIYYDWEDINRFNTPAVFCDYNVAWDDAGHGGDW